MTEPKGPDAARPQGERRVWERPHITSVAIPEVEALLAESYKAQAKSWADAAKRARQEAAAGQDAG